MKKPSPSTSKDDDEILGHASGLPPLVPDGEYTGYFVRAEHGYYEGRKRTFLWFAIMTPGPHVDQELFLACPHPKNGTTFGNGSKLMQAYAVALGHFPKKRKDPLSKKVFKNKLFNFRVRMVVKDRDGNPKAKEDQYSVIDKLSSVEVGA